MVLIANRDLSSLRQEPPRRWREASLDTVILVWGARMATPLLFVACASSLIEDHLSVLGEAWSIALQLALMIAGIALAYFAMPAPVRGRHQIRRILLTVASIGLVVVLGLWNVLGITVHLAKVRSVEAMTVQWDQQKTTVPLP